jgi:hypothetical protein
MQGSLTFIGTLAKLLVVGSLLDDVKNCSGQLHKVHHIQRLEKEDASLRHK